MEIRLFIRRIGTAAIKTLQVFPKTFRFPLLIMIFVSFAVLILDISGILYYISHIIHPALKYIDLPGEAVLVLLASMFLNMYAVLAVSWALNLSVREITILATICCIAHNVFAESFGMKKTGSAVSKMILLRLVCMVSAGSLHFIIPDDFGDTATGTAPFITMPQVIGFNVQDIQFALIPWINSIGTLVVKIIPVVFLIIFIQQIAEIFGILPRLGKIIAPFMGIMGLPAGTSYAWMVINVQNISNAVPILTEDIRSGALSESETDLFNYHGAINHAQIEDTLLFIWLGVPYIWAALPRFILAFIIVWLERGRRALVRHSFKVNIG